MVNKQLLNVTLILSVILLGGVTGCSGGSPSSDASNPEGSGANVSSTTNPSASDKSARAQRREEIRKQIEAVLTPDQTKQLQEKLQQGERMRKALQSLNLTDEQKTKIQAILNRAYGERQRKSGNNSQ